MTGRPRLLVAVLLALVGPAACGGDVLTADEVPRGAEDAFAEQAGTGPDVTCPEDIEEEVGARTRCLLTAEALSDELGVTVTVTSVDDEGTRVSVEVDQAPTGGGS